MPVQGLSQATDISSSDEEVRQAGIKLLTGAIEVRQAVAKMALLIGRLLPAVLLPVRQRSSQAGLWAVCVGWANSGWEAWQFLANSQSPADAGAQHSRRPAFCGSQLWCHGQVPETTVSRAVEDLC